MDPNLDQRLQAIEQKLTDTYKIVAKMRQSQRTAAAVRALYWIFIILLGFGAFYFIQPYLGQLTQIYGLTSGSGDSGTVQTLLKQLNVQVPQQ